MPTVSAGTTATYTFPLTQTVTISPDSNESAAVTVTRGGVIIFSGAITSGQSIGPYIAGDVLTVTAQRGAVDYTVESVPAAVPGAGIFTEGEIAAIRALIGVVPANTLYVGSSPLLVNGAYLRVA